MTHQRLGSHEIIKEGDELYVHELKDWENVFFPNTKEKVGSRMIRREKVVKNKVSTKKKIKAVPRVIAEDMIELKEGVGSLHKVIAVSPEFNQAYTKAGRVLFANISRVYREVR